MAVIPSGRRRPLLTFGSAIVGGVPGGTDEVGVRPVSLSLPERRSQLFLVRTHWLPLRASAHRSLAPHLHPTKSLRDFAETPLLGAEAPAMLARSCHSAFDP